MRDNCLEFGLPGRNHVLRVIKARWWFNWLMNWGLRKSSNLISKLTSSHSDETNNRERLTTEVLEGYIEMLDMLHKGSFSLFLPVSVCFHSSKYFSKRKSHFETCLIWSVLIIRCNHVLNRVAKFNEWQGNYSYFYTELTKCKAITQTVLFISHQ